MNTFMRSIFMGLGLFAGVSASAQQLPVMNHYLYNPFLYNPARTGDSGLGSINMNFKRQWTAMPYAPLTGALSMEAAIPSTDMGVGAILYSDRTHIVSRVGGMATYAYHIPFSKEYEHHLSGGISLGVINQRFDFQAATVQNPNDPQILGDEAAGTAFDFSGGLNYRWKNLNVGLSMLQALNNQIRFLSAMGEEVKYINTRHFMSMASYDFELGANKEIMLRPVVMARFIKGLPVQVESNVVVSWKKLLWGGLGYRSSNNETSTSALVATLGVELKQRIFMAYTFEIGVDGKLNKSLGSQHEFMMAYRFGRNDENDKKMASLNQEIERLKNKDMELQDLIKETNKRVDTLAVTTQEMQENVDNLKSITNDIKNNEQSNAKATEEMTKKLNEQAEMLNAQQSAIDKNRKDIDELREAIKKQPMKYKKLGEINFGNGSNELTATEKSKLDALKGALSDSPNTVLYLYGNASTDGDPAKNMQLSTKRCIEVRKHLVSLGLPGERIIVLPMGQENTKTGTTAVNASDRRVDVILTEK